MSHPAHVAVKTASIFGAGALRIRQERVAASFPGVDWDQPRTGCVRKEPAMADAAVVGILMVSMGFVMWIGHLLAGVVSGVSDGGEDGL
jgi:hypothetical protein